MPSLTTVLRAIIMLAAAVLIVNCWKSYGPTGEQLKSLASRAVQVAANGKEAEKSAEGNGDLVAVEQSEVPIAPPLAQTASMAAVGSPTPSGGSSPHDPNQPAASSAVLEADDRLTKAAGDVIVSGPESERFPALLTRLESLGGMEPRLTPWGSTRRLYRFSCRASIADMPSYARHFESVSEQPLVAVEDVIAKVAAWRMAQQQSKL